MKDHLYKFIALIILCSIVFTGCTSKTYNMIIMNKKPSKFYYTSELCKELNETKGFTASIFQVNLHKEVPILKEDLSTIENFFTNLNTENFIDKPEGIKEKPQYKIFIESNNEKFVVNVYDEKYISIHPWDGTFEMDYIDMSDVYKAYNLYGFCKYILKEP